MIFVQSPNLKVKGFFYYCILPNLTPKVIFQLEKSSDQNIFVVILFYPTMW